jgi:hypothetical protein
MNYVVMINIKHHVIHIRYQGQALDSLVYNYTTSHYYSLGNYSALRTVLVPFNTNNHLVLRNYQ